VAHSNDFWELRPGFVGRYHWLLARHKLAALFQTKVTEQMRTSVLNSVEALLKEKKMWPLPAGILSSKWLEQVDASSLDDQSKIELLQNEYIFRNQVNDVNNKEIVRQKILSLGGTVLASLDVKDSPAYGSTSTQPHVLVELEPLLVEAGDAIANPAGVLVERAFESPFQAVRNDDPRVQAEFAALGEMFQIGNFIISGAQPLEMSHNEARNFCHSLGGELPSIAQWEVFLAGSTRFGEYVSSTLPHLDWQFWTLEGTHVFSGYAGTLRRVLEIATNNIFDEIRASVRCVHEVGTEQ